ncbi:hypothetical protein RvY_02913 [Ramazzottius varieornatus]|uniref:Uncharacterized protein n=1 Tax=Ramazzottius varieornatus TaxID=947166 RepID=A0A1D1UTD3_RAMVA|nr:hypothetical protein RvY_02913 [Ramazzottius varieornatus]
MANTKIIGSLCEQYGFDVLTGIREIFWTLPENLPEEAAYQALKSALQLNRADIRYLIKHLLTAAPQILQNNHHVIVEVFELDRVVKQGFEHTLRHTFCGSRYSYFTYYNATSKKQFLYENQRILRVSKYVYVTRDESELLINDM